MIDFKGGKVNLIVGPTNNGKTTTLLNICSDIVNKEIKKKNSEQGEILFFANDLSSNIIEDKFMAIHEDINLISVKRDKDNKHTIGSLPSIFHVSNNPSTLNELITEIKKSKKHYPFEYIIIDNLNQYELNKDLPYKDRFKDAIDRLYEIIKDTDTKIIISFYLLKMAMWENDGRENFSSNDEETIGTLTVIHKEDNYISLATDDKKNTVKYKLTSRNLKLSKI